MSHLPEIKSNFFLEISQFEFYTQGLLKYGLLQERTFFKHKVVGIQPGGSLGASTSVGAHTLASRLTVKKILV